MSYELILGDCLEVMPTLPANSIDSIVCDPPYGLSFMGKAWDHGVPGVPFWEAALRVAKPGAMLLAFGGSRTHHRLMCAIEDAGWEIRDCLMWLYGSGFPKSMDISKAIDKAAGAEREVVGESPYNARRPNQGETGNGTYGQGGYKAYVTAPSTDVAKDWQGWGTALKPAWEPIIMAMKPIDGTFANNALAHGVAGINVDGCRVAGSVDAGWTKTKGNGPKFTGNTFNNGAQYPESQEKFDASPQGRWPANLILDEEAARLLDEQSGHLDAGGPGRPTPRHIGASLPMGGDRSEVGYGDTGGASRFFFCAKASKRDRDEGLEGMPMRSNAEREGRNQYKNGTPLNGSGNLINGDGHIQPKANFHPTVKPTQLCRYLVRLVTRPGGVVLDPFMGSGSTGKAAMLEGFSFIGIDKDADYLEIARRRIEHARAQLPLFDLHPAHAGGEARGA